jgi:hypothetical protein
VSRSFASTLLYLSPLSKTTFPRWNDGELE